MDKGMTVEEITPNRPVKGLYLVREKRLLYGKTGKPYLLLKLMDHSGEIQARIWDQVELLSAQFRVGDLVWISGEAVVYQGSLQVKVQDLLGGPTPTADDLPLFIPGYKEALSRAVQCYEEVLKIAGSIRHPGYRRLAGELLQDEGLKEGWLLTPAAKNVHHRHTGGLIEHTLSVCRLAELICGHYPALRRDMLLTGAILHDIGKIREFDAPLRGDYTTEGRLIGHVVMGAEMVEKKAVGLEDLSAGELMELKHLILSHHGHMEFGSPKRPKTLEALALHMIDDLDAKMDAFRSHMEQGQSEDEQWTTFHPIFNRYLYRGGEAEQEKP